MKITLLHSKLDVALRGVAPIVSFHLTQQQLRQWNRLQWRSVDGVSFNEAWNAEQGLPCPNARAWLLRLHRDRFGSAEPAGVLTWAHVKAALSA